MLRRQVRSVASTASGSSSTSTGATTGTLDVRRRQRRRTRSRSSRSTPTPSPPTLDGWGPPRRRDVSRRPPGTVERRRQPAPSATCWSCSRSSAATAACTGEQPLPGRDSARSRSRRDRVVRHRRRPGLVAAAQGGDRDALDQLLRRHYDRIHAVCRRITGSTRDADDAAQEAMIAHRARPAPLRRARPVRHVGLPHRHQRRARRAAPAQAPPGSSPRRRRSKRGTGATTPTDEPLSAGRGRRRPPGDRRRARRPAGGLPRAVVLRDVADLDYAEIAEVLGVPVGTVKSRIARGRGRSRRRAREPRPGDERPTREDRAAPTAQPADEPPTAPTTHERPAHSDARHEPAPTSTASSTPPRSRARRGRLRVMAEVAQLRSLQEAIRERRRADVGTAATPAIAAALGRVRPHAALPARARCRPRRRAAPAGSPSPLRWSRARSARRRDRRQTRSRRRRQRRRRRSEATGRRRGRRRLDAAVTPRAARAGDAAAGAAAAESAQSQAARATEQTGAPPPTTTRQRQLPCRRRRDDGRCERHRAAAFDPTRRSRTTVRARPPSDASVWPSWPRGRVASTTGTACDGTIPGVVA